jgi:hypothetical protein
MPGPEGIARNVSYWKAVDNGEIISLGVHRDILAKSEGRWMVRQRVVEHTWTKVGGNIPKAPSF